MLSSEICAILGWGARARTLFFRSYDFTLCHFYYFIFRCRRRLQIFESIFLVCPDFQWKIKRRKRNSKTKAVEKEKIRYMCTYTPRSYSCSFSFSFSSLFRLCFLCFAFRDGFDRYQSNIYVEMFSFSLLFSFELFARCWFVWFQLQFQFTNQSTVCECHLKWHKWDN